MELYSLSFVLLVTVGLVLYYTVLRRYQWLCLLAISLVFFAASGWQGIFFLFFTALTVWGGGLWLARLDADCAARRKVPGITKDEKKAGVLYGIGVGPGDPEFMTIKAIQTIKKCDAIVLPAATKEECYAYGIASQVCPEMDEKRLLCMPFPMIKEQSKLEKAHDEIFETLESELKAGRNVGLLTIGDPSVYSTYMYIHHRAEAAGYEAVMISGVPSFCAVAARLGISLGEKSEEIHIIPGTYEVQKTFDYSGTCVYMKSGKRLAELIAVLRDQECEGRLLYVRGVSNCGMENERVYQSLNELELAQGYLTIVIVKMTDEQTM